MSKLLALMMGLTFLGLGQAQAEPVQAKLYQFDNVQIKKSYLYVVLSTQSAAQIFNCRNDIFSPTGDLVKFIGEHCAEAIVTDPKKNNGMFNVVRDKSLISFHLGGTKWLALQGLDAMMAGKSKSWLAVFSLDLKNDENLLFTGTGIEIGGGTPRIDSVRLSLRKIAEFSLQADLPLIPFERE